MEKKKIRLGIGQINCTVGDLAGNYTKIADYIAKASSRDVDILSFPELAITGYPPEDLLLRNSFIEDNMGALEKAAACVQDMVVVVGFVDRSGKDLYNAAAIIYKAKIFKTYHKMFLPNYGVFDEKRYFKSGSHPDVFNIGGVVFGVNICEDIWHDDGPVKTQALSGAALIININSSPYHAGRMKDREGILKKQARANNVIISYANLVGGQDELVFDGRSMIVDNRGTVVDRAFAFKEDLLISDVEVLPQKAKQPKTVIVIAGELGGAEAPILKREERQLAETPEIYGALVLGLKDYVEKNGFKKTVVGLSGGIDSSLVACLAVDALGKDNVVGVYMPTHYSSVESERDARAVAINLGIRFFSIPVDHIFKIYLMALEPHFAALAKDITEENLQARIRATMLMALSNKFGWIVLTTGNKSEMSTGYATLYGDMAGGFAVIKDVPKMLVYELAKHRNSVNKVIPECVFTKAPMAELRHDQKDSDTLPPYEKLDPILRSYVEEDLDINKITARGFDRQTVNKVLNMVDRSEYKRRQAPPGIKITPKAFGKDRRMPITNKYKY